MNKIVKTHYPVSRLPKELQEGLEPDAEVTVTLEQERTPRKIMSFEEIFAARQPPYRTKEEIDRWIRELRDEWDD